MKKIKLIAFLVVVAFCITKVNAQINFDFKTADQVAKWKGTQCTLSHVDNDFMKMSVTGGFWAVAPYAPEGGLNWNFDTDKVIVIKEQYKKGELFVKFYDAVASANYQMNDPLPLTVANSTSLIYVIAFENYATQYPDIQSGIKKFTDFQIAHTYVNVGDEVVVDFVKSFPTIDAAYEFVGPIVEGTSAVHSLTDSPITVYVVNSNIKIAKMDREDLVNVYDTKGAIIKSQRMMNGVISGLSKGVYVVKTGDKVAKVVL